MCVSLGLSLAFVFMASPQPPSTIDAWPACDQITTGTDCVRFTAGDVDGDGFADLLTINGNRDLCVAPSVHGWKSAGWRALAGDVDPQAVGLAIVRGASDVRVVVVEAQRVVIVPIAANGVAAERRVVTAATEQVFTGVVPAEAVTIQDAAGGHWHLDEADALVAIAAPSTVPAALPSLTAPPYEPQARELCRFAAPFSARGGQQVWAVFAAQLPHAHHVVRTAVVAGDDASDGDADGLADAEEAAFGTDPRDRDSDGDGLLDGWEVHGFPGDRAPDLGARLRLFDPAATGDVRDHQLDPRRRDVIVNISYFEQVDRARFAAELPRIEAVYRALSVRNSDGSTGVWLHFRDLAASVPAADQGMAWWDVGNKHFPASERGLMHWMQVTPFGGGQSSETGDMGGSGNGWAVFAHELGHQLSLSHTGDSAPGWCPLYPSLMNYAYSYSFDGDGNRPHFSNGEFRALELDERHLSERLPFAWERVKFLANHPFRFTLADNGDGTTNIDWNHNGAFDDGEVIADINYGGSTHAGVRKTYALIGSAPALATIGDRCFLAAATPKQNAVTVASCRGDEQWTAVTEVASSATRFDPVLVGGAERGVLFVRRFDGWAIADVRAGAGTDAVPVVSPLRPLPALTAGDVSALAVGERLLLLARRDDGAIERRWLAPGDAPQLGEPTALALQSAVPPGLTIDPRDGSIVVVSSARHPKNGAFCMQTSTLRVDGDDVVETPAAWTHDGRVCHCTSRPVPVFTGVGGAPLLTIFHTGWTDANGTWTGWRTTRVGNVAHDGGWLTCQLYDEWTRSRVALGFADGPQGAFYAFRWDPGDHGEWKVNTLFVAAGGYGIDEQPMRDFDDGAKIGLWGIRHSILTMRTDAECGR